MSNDHFGNDENDLGTSWLSNADSTSSDPAPSETEIGSFLRNSIPAPKPGYWEAIDLSLERAAGDEPARNDIDREEVDTDTTVVRPMVMTTKSTPNKRSPLLWAAAAALVVFGAIGAIALSNRSGDNASRELATAPETTAQPTTEAAGSEPDDTTTDGTTTEGAAATTTDPTAVGAGPLTEMQRQLADPSGDEFARFCFAADDVLIVPATDITPDRAIVLSTLQAGNFTFNGMQNQEAAINGSAAGSSDGRLEATTTGYGTLRGLLPPYQLTLTDDAISIGDETTLPLVPCGDIEDEIEVLNRLLILESQRIQFESELGAGGPAVSRDTPPTVGPLTAIQQRLDGDDGEHATYCFVGTDPSALARGSSDVVVMELQVLSDATLVMFGISLDNILWGVGSGDRDGNLTFEVDGYSLGGPYPQDVPFTMVLTDENVTFSEEVRLVITDCAWADEDLQPLRSVAAQSLRDTADESAQPSLGHIPDDAILSSVGLGPIHIGMPVSELSNDLGIDVDFDTIGIREVGACGWITTVIDEGVSALIEVTGPNDAIVRRVGVFSDRWETPSGIRVGMTEQSVLDAFGEQLDIRPHVYVANGNYLTFLPTDPNDPNTVEFWTEEGLVTQIYAGDRNWVSFIEGCA